MSQVVLLSGPSGAGKSSVAEALCERYDRTVHIETDTFFGALRMGFISPMKPESARQNAMISRAVARAATAYADDIYAVMIDGVIGPHLLPVYLEELSRASVPVQFVLLMPSLEETLRRVAAREGGTRRMPAAEHRALYAQFERYGAFAGCSVDNTSMTAQEAADRVMALCGSGDCVVTRPG